MQPSPSVAQPPPGARTAASSLLAKFLPTNSPTSHKMDYPSNLRPQSQVSYAESEGSETSPPQTPEKERAFAFEQDPKDEEDDLIMFEDRKSSRGRTLRPAKNGVTISYKNRAKDQSHTRNRKNSAPQGFNLTPHFTDRQAIRNEIETVTTANRNRFLLLNKDYFLPLLPEGNNYVKKLVQAHNALTEDEKSTLPSAIPYEQLEVQPKHVKAVMKPYQISGLSYLVYLHRNGLSGILGDEMGLGKTLQTLSLVQYLKENTPKAARQSRPFLVLCPLSVLSSWMKEAKKWTPGLKVLRFHGSAKERERLKRVASGVEDMFGNLTQKQKAKLNSRRAAKGETIVLDPDDSDDGSQAGVDIIVATYEGFLAEQGWFKRAFVWRYAVLDEGHKVKNEESLISKGLQGLQAEYRLILTGTPLQNNLAELWALLHWLYPDVFTDQTRDLFRQSFDLNKGLYSDTTLNASRQLLELIMLRRMKNSPGVDINLPPKTEILLFVPLSPMQRFWYTRLITRADEGLLNDLFKGAKDKVMDEMKQENDVEAKSIDVDLAKLEASSSSMITSGPEWDETKEILAKTLAREEAATKDEGVTTAWRKLMNLMMQLRKVCNHPYQITNAEPDPYELGDHIITASGKFIVLEKLINELVIKQKKKILIFSGFTRMLDLVQDFLLIRGGDGSQYNVCRLDGSTARARRNLGIHMFNKVDSDYRVMLISTRAGGLGINLATASDVLFLDQDWNPQITLQAEARAHRIGQVNPVTVYKFISQGTVEEQMMGRISKKLYLSAKVTESMQDIHTPAGKKSKRKGGPASNTDDMPQLSTGQLMALVRRGTSALSRPEVDINEMLSWDWETTVAKCKDKPADVSVKKDAVSNAAVDKEEEQKWLSEMERVEASIFEGKKLARIAGTGKATTTAGEIAAEWNRADRRVGKNVTVMVEGFAISKESMGCADWEAVPTMAGKDPRLADVKREAKPKVNHQSHCQVCLDGGELHLCQHCPRSYHMDCMADEFKAKAKGSMFNCPQHQCDVCEQKTTDAGGMLYRCRWCERAYCEDCLDFDKTELIGDNLKEYELLQYPAMTQAFYVECQACHEHFSDDPKEKKICEDMARDVDARYEAAQKAFTERRDASPSAEGSLTDGTTIGTTGGVNTPVLLDDNDDEPVVVNKNGKRAGERKVAAKVKVRGSRKIS